eukprot:2173801-Pyramimonas_sp.AAC.1
MLESSGARPLLDYPGFSEGEDLKEGGQDPISRSQRRGQHSDLAEAGRKTFQRSPNPSAG